MESIRCTKKGTSLKITCYILIGMFIFLMSVNALQLDLSKFIERFANLPEVISRMMQLDVSIIPNVLAEILVSISLAFAALVFGTLISFVLACLSASNIAPNKHCASVIKGVIATIRAIPALVWVLMVVASIGFGNTGGMIGLIFPTVGYLSKSFAASFEEEGYDRIEALKATGANWTTTITSALVPQTMPKLISWIAMRFENNIAEGISLGMVGVGGVGYLLNKAIGKFDYASISTILLMIFLTMFIMELLIQNVKKQIHKG